MRFKRQQVRYADTPQPATPYQAAAQVWDERIGSARVQAKNWRLMAFGCLVLALLMAGGLVWRSAQSIVTPYVVEVDNAGQVRAVGEAATPYRPNDAQTAHHIARRSEEHTSELQSLMRISYAVFCLKKKKTHRNTT